MQIFSIENVKNFCYILTSQFKIIDALNRYAILDFANKNTWIKEHKSHACNINGKATYFRILIQKIKVSE